MVLFNSEIETECNMKNENHNTDKEKKEENIISSRKRMRSGEFSCLLCNSSAEIA
jgi:hypothetical protein